MVRAPSLALALALLSGACTPERAPRVPAVSRSPEVGPAARPLEGASPQIASVSQGSGQLQLTSVELPAATYREPLPAKLPGDAKAVVYGAMSPATCYAEVKSRALPAARVKTHQRGVEAPMRLSGKLHGVRLVVPPDSVKFGVLDCRLVLALDDLSEALAAAQVDAIVFDNFYRPNAKLPGRGKASQHAFGLAADITAFQLADGRRLSTTAWGAAIGEVACGPDATMASPTPESVEVRNLVCSIARAGLFNTLLTPSFNAAHQSHFHFDLKSGSSQLSLR